jgi:hypothetical protein
MCRTDVLNWLERLGARRVAIDLQDSSLPQVDLRFLALRHPEIQVHPAGCAAMPGVCHALMASALGWFCRVSGNMCRGSDQQTAAAVADGHCHIRWPWGKRHHA